MRDKVQDTEAQTWSKRRSAEDGIRKIPTGTKGFDEFLQGGLPEGRTTLIAGSMGTGKTVLINELLYREVTEYGQNGVFVTVEERPSDIQKNVENFRWDYKALIRANRDVSPDINIETSPDSNLSPLVERVKYAISGGHPHHSDPNHPAHDHRCQDHSGCDASNL